MISIEDLKNKQKKVCVVGLGYVGLPLAILLAKQFDVIGFDIDTKKIEELQHNIDMMNEVSTETLTSSTLNYSADPSSISEASFIIVAVPTPVDSHNIPNLNILKKATEMVGTNMKEGCVVVFESTVYPGVTTEICVPILERVSGLVYNKSFFVGYSPERVNPGDKKHTIDKITKVVSGSTPEALRVVSDFYGTITTTFAATSIEVAEAAKVIENVQRDINIGLMNELTVLFHTMGISVYDVLEAAGTKWNFLPFTPGLVGGHCIGVDPYYLTYRAQELGIPTEMILAGRATNDRMAPFFVEQIIKRAVQSKIALADATVVIFGITFKENVKDIRNSKVVDMYHGLKEYGLTVHIVDPIADAEEVEREYRITLSDPTTLSKADIAVFAVSHDAYKAYTEANFAQYLKNQDSLIVDMKHMFATLPNMPYNLLTF